MMFCFRFILGMIVLFDVSVVAHVLRPRDCSFTWPAFDGDTCKSMAETWSISEAQFISYNPGVDCFALVTGKEYCVEWQGNLPFPSSPTKPSTSSFVRSTTTKPVTSSSTIKITSSPKPPTTSSLKPTTTTAVGSVAPSPTQDGLVKDCKRFHLVSSGDTCQGIVDKYKTFTLSQFYSWNPAVGTSCDGLWLSYYVCIGTKDTPTSPTKASTTPTPTKPSTPTGSAKPSPTQPDVSTKCSKWHLVASGDICQKIADEYKITLANFYKWNPYVGNTCANLWLGYYVCVGLT